MKYRNNSYREVDRLPMIAMTVGEYADLMGFNHTQVYKKWRGHIGKKKKAIAFEIVLFKDRNFIIPKK